MIFLRNLDILLRHFRIDILPIGENTIKSCSNPYFTV